MKKTLFLTVSFVAFIIMMQTYAWAASTSHKFDLGTISSNYSWSNEPLNDYSLTFTVNNDAGVNVKINFTSNQIIWFFDGKEKKWSSNTDSDKDSNSWVGHFDTGSYTLNIYGKTVSTQMLLSGANGRKIEKDSDNPVPLPSALIFLVSGILGLFTVGRFKRTSA
ncbi:MAG: hypothetical protein HQK70_11550 [Desulfamplus sp.]|nr:hypothetical protein [Desulfamplus sp.]